MFGAYRCCLALLVVAAHLGGVVGAGTHAVFGFYLLSGHLMTLVLHRVYGFRSAGTVRYLANRALRIFPPYLVVVLGAACLVATMPEFAVDFRSSLRLPSSAAEWLSNLLIVGIQPEDPSRLVPPAWSLHVELVFYLAMGLVLARSRLVTALWFVASLAFTVHLIASGASWGERYYPVTAASLPFSTGALIYHMRSSIPRIPIAVGACVSALFLLHAAAAPRIWSDFRLDGFYVSFVLAALVLICLMHVRRRDVAGWIARADAIAGDLAYPIFLCHVHVGLLLAHVMPLGSRTQKLAWFAASVGLTLVAAYGIHALVERPVDRLRDRFRGRQRAQFEDAAPSGALTASPRTARLSGRALGSSASAESA